MTNPTHQSDWRRLFNIAYSIIEQANADHTIIDYWTFGGGTAMMIQIDHRESHDIDFFLLDPQLLPFLDPSKQNFTFEIAPTDYVGDGTRSLKINFETGEIDFIVGKQMTDHPTIEWVVEGKRVLLETLSEIIAKKIFYRGASLKPRDIFDIAAVGERHVDTVIAALKSYPDKVAAALKMIDKLNPDFVNAAIQQLMIRDSYLALSKRSIERARELLEAV